MRKYSCHSWFLQGHILILQANWEILTKWFPGLPLPEKMQIYQNKTLIFFFILKSLNMSKYSVSHPEAGKNLLISTFLAELSFLIQMCRRNIANWLFLAAWETIPTTRNDPVSLPLEWLSNTPCQEPILIGLESPAVPLCEPRPGTASAMVSLPVRQRKQRYNSYSGRKLSSLTPASSPQQGHYLPAHSSLLGSPSYNPSAPAALIWIEWAMIKIPQKWDRSQGMYSALLQALKKLLQW